MPDKETLNFVLSRGKQYTPALLPSHISRGAMGKCFDNCMVRAMLDPNLKYVEGVVMTATKQKWILHAWLTDGVHAYDPTWYCLNKEKKERPVPGIYIGIEMELKKVAKFVSVTEYASVLANRWRNEALAAEALQLC